MKAIDKAITRAGTATRLAELLEVSAMTISHWRNRYKGLFPPIVFFEYTTPLASPHTSCAPTSIQTQLTVYLNRSLNNAKCFISTE